MNPNQDQLAELHEQGENVYIKKNDWYGKLGLGRQETEHEIQERIDAKVGLGR